MILYPQRLHLAQTPTPFYALDRLTEKLSAERQPDAGPCPRIWIKRDDLSGCLTTGNKVRKLEFLLAEAKAKGCDTIITCGGVQSNHCRATAILGKQLGFNVHLLLRSDSEPEPIGNLLLDQLVGATINHYSQQAFKSLDQLFEHWQAYYQQLGQRCYSIPTGGSNGTGLWGYIAAAEELKADFERENIRPSRIIHASGSGGTQAGLTLGCWLAKMDVQVEGYAVCDDAAYFRHRMTQDIRQWSEQYAIAVDIEQLTININDHHSGPSYGVAYPEVFDEIKQLAALEAVILDPVYTGKAFQGLVKEIRQGRFVGESDIVFVHTGGIFGLLAQQQQLGY